MIKHYLEYETYHEVFGYLKKYPNFERLIIYDKPIQVKLPGFELPKKHQKDKNSKENPIAFLESIRRSKTVISDITICNEFDLFVTFTFKKDRQNIDKLKKQMSKWLENQKTSVGKFNYIIIPEFHKDGKSIHFHALFKNYKGKLKDSGKLINGRKAYNLTSYRLGFSSAVKIDNVAKVSSYVRKYIIKDMPKFPGKKRYWSSQNLKRPIVVENPTLHPCYKIQYVEKSQFKHLTIYERKYTVPNVTNLSEGTNKWHKQLETSIISSKKSQSKRVYLNLVTLIPS